jgi:hypothetical protein
VWPVTPRGRISPTAQAHREAHCRLAEGLGRPPTIREWATAAGIGYDTAKALKFRWIKLGCPLAFTPVGRNQHGEPCRPIIRQAPVAEPVPSRPRQTYSPVPAIDALIREWRQMRKRGAA